MCTLSLIFEPLLKSVNMELLLKSCNQVLFIYIFIAVGCELVMNRHTNAKRRREKFTEPHIIMQFHLAEVYKNHRKQNHLIIQTQLHSRLLFILTIFYPYSGWSLRKSGFSKVEVWINWATSQGQGSRKSLHPPEKLLQHATPRKNHNLSSVYVSERF